MLAEYRARAVEHHEWTLPPVVGDLELNSVFEQAAEHRCGQANPLSGVAATVVGGRMVVGYMAESPAGPDGHLGSESAPARRECDALCADVERDRDEWERRSGIQRATLLRIRDLADEWSNSGFLTYQAASHRLHELLDGPGAEPAEPGDWERRALAAEAKVARVAALAGSWSQYRDVALKSAGTDGLGELHIRPVREAADLLLAALADTEAGA